MSLQNWLAIHLVRPYISNELPGWGTVYRRFVGDYRQDNLWEDASPRIIREKRCGTFRVVELREWADRFLFFLRRWYDLETALVAEALIRPGHCVLDIGANYGHFSMEAAFAAGPTGRVLAFEPNPASYTRLSMHLRLNNFQQIQAFQLGLSDSEGELELNIPKSSGEATFGTSKYDETCTVKCPVEKLDTAVGGTLVDFVKIDVEGFEPYVLRGAKNTISSNRPPVLTEVVKSHLECAGESVESLSTFFSALDYIPFRTGLQRAGWQGIRRQYTLKLSQSGSDLEDGDYLWMPRESIDLIRDFIPSL